MGRALVCGTARPAWAVWPAGAGMRSGSQAGPAAAVGARGSFRARLRLWHSEPPESWVAVTLPTCAGLLGDSGMWQAMEHRAEDEARGDEATFDHLRNPRLLGKPRIRKASRPAGKISPRAPPVRLSHGHGGPALGESLIDTQTLRARGLVWALHRWKHPDGSAKGQALLAHPGVGGPVLGKDVSVPICKTGAWLGPPAAQLHGPYNSAAGSTAAPVSQVGNRVRGRGPVLGSHGEDAAGVWPARSLRAGAAAHSPASPVTRHQPPAASRSPSPSTSPPHDI